MLRHRNEYPVEGRLPVLDGATAWVNTGSVAHYPVEGRVSLVCFGTYTCINWIRTSPYVRAWSDKYTGAGLAVVGVQTPEFAFERELDNVRRAMNDMDVRYPVAVDNNYAVWTAFDNHYWPALYFADVQGRIRHHRAGEGEYEDSEMVLQMLLREAGADVDQGLVSLVPQGVGGPGRLGQPWLGGGLRRLRARGGVCVARRGGARRASRLCGAGGARAQPVGAVGRVADRPGLGSPGRATRFDLLPVPRP
jgi:hypothetical protein